MKDYIEIIQELFQKYYSSKPIEGYAEKFLSTSEVLKMFRGLIPSEPIDEHDIFDVMTELGFQQELKIFFIEVPILDEDGEKTGETKEVESGRYFLWKTYEKEILND